ncbi:PREDICTED: transmembrane protein 246 [Nanorana parkeri]|uniref:transmembrane protein 246 n=1 Tax=Nanorana parkeri TaxID=125878 RepID=UPI00085430EA|nr:PREDICTED: transmembrane protein 246 [Nanorana parkeri]
MRLSAIFRSPCFHSMLLIVLTLLLTPICFRNLLYSPLFSRQLNLKRLSREFLQRNLQDGSNAFQHFHQTVSMSSTFPPNTSVPCILRPAGSLRPSHVSGTTTLAVTIITTRRRSDYHYLLQVARGFLDRMSECGKDCSTFQILICNVDSFPEDHSDACLLSHLLPMVARDWSKHVDKAPNRFEQEKQDYAFCLSRTLEAYNPKYVLLIEDDAVPLEDIFTAFFHLVQVRFPQEPLGGGLYVKFYHPERLQGYINPEPMRILEWIGLGGLAGLVLTWVYTLTLRHQQFSWRVFVAFTIYAMLLAELAGRHYLLELRRISPALYNVVPVTECCTPAMLFSEVSAGRTLSYLKEIECKPGYAKDIALYHELRRRGEWAWALEPNMVKHVGMFSTLRGSFEGEEPQLL